MVRIVAIIGIIQCIIGLLSVGLLAWSGGYSLPIPVLVSGVQLLSFGICGIALVFFGRMNVASSSLGATLILVAATFGLRPTSELLIHDPDAFPGPIIWIYRLCLDALLPFMLWRFVTAFPTGISGRWKPLAVVVISITGIVGISLIAINTFPATFPLLESTFDRDIRNSHYWTLVYSLVLPFPLVVYLRIASTRDIEGFIRGRLFLLGLSLVLPASLVILTFSIFVEDENLINNIFWNTIGLPFVHILMMFVPVITTYSIFVENVIDLGRKVRNVTRYLFARQALIFLNLIPIITSIWILYSLRELSLGQLFRDPRLITFLLLSALIWVVRDNRRSLRQKVDRALFRDYVNPTIVKHNITDKVISETETESLIRTFEDNLTLELRLSEVAVLVLKNKKIHSENDFLTNEETDLIISGCKGSLPQPIGKGRYFFISRTGPNVAYQEIVVLTGKKLNEEPLSDDEELLILDLCKSLQTWLDNVSYKAVLPRAPDSQPAKECKNCRIVYRHAVDCCKRCGNSLTETGIPFLISGKYELKERIGRTAADVYVALDVELGRHVVVKSLPNLASSGAESILIEGRAMAMLSHPSLATVHAVETWKGVPLLVVELLEGGTLMDRLDSGIEMPRDISISMAIQLLDGLVYAHDKGVIHRDIKPSNIGFSDSDKPKLLDFGTASMLATGHRISASLPKSEFRQTCSFGGTPLYMSPEALQGYTPEPVFDLWSIAVSFYEAVFAKHPFERATWRDTMIAIQKGVDSDNVTNDQLGQLFLTALNSDTTKRPQSAKQFKSMLESIA